MHHIDHPGNQCQFYFIRTRINQHLVYHIIFPYFFTDTRLIHRSVTICCGIILWNDQRINPAISQIL